MLPLVSVASCGLAQQLPRSADQIILLWTGTEHVGLLQEYLGVLNEAFFEGVGLLNTLPHGAAPILTGEAGSAICVLITDRSQRYCGDD